MPSGGEFSIDWNGTKGIILIMIRKQNLSTPYFRAVDCAVICVGSKLALIGDRKQRRNECVHLPQKRVLDEMAGKEKAVPKEAEMASFGTACCWCHIISEL